MSDGAAIAPGREAEAGTPGPRRVGGQVHPAAKALRKHEKSATFRIGGVVEPSQLAYESPAAKRLRKQEKSWMLRIGGLVEESQLG